MMTPEELDYLEKRVLFEDNHLLIVNKKATEIVQSDTSEDAPLSEKYKLYLKKKHDEPRKTILGITHRLDRPSSGVVIFTKSPKALARINKMLQDHAIQKKYWVITAKELPEQKGTLEHYLVRNQKKNKSFVSKTASKNAKKAVLEYKWLGKSDRYFLYEITLITGRHHQIRAQLAAMGTPVKGDLKYGFKTTNSNGSISLHARQVNFIHPITNKPIQVIAGTAKDNLWNYFEENFG